MSDIVQILREMIPHGRVMTVSERAEADMAAKYAADEIERLRAGLKNIVDSYDARSELFTCDADCAANLADHARHAIKDAKRDGN